MKKSLVLQLHLLPYWIDQDSHLERLSRIIDDYCLREGAQSRIEDGARHSEWINIEVSVIDPIAAWKRLRTEVAADEELYGCLKKRWIVVGQGSEGWSDYKMLGHYDPGMTLDTDSG
jgi:hypothetical protein